MTNRPDQAHADSYRGEALKILELDGDSRDGVYGIIAALLAIDTRLADAIDRGACDHGQVGFCLPCIRLALMQAG